MVKQGDCCWRVQEDYEATSTSDSASWEQLQTLKSDFSVVVGAEVRMIRAEERLGGKEVEIK